MLRSLISAFLMYSRIPMPKISWKEENLRYALGVFPLVGAVIGALLVLWHFFCVRLSLGQMFFAAGASAIPVFVTGGIHMDGFCDTVDAKASYADKEKKLKILADPHIGSFAVINICLYLILQTALFTQAVSAENIVIIGCGYVLSRVLSALSAITFKNAKNEGTLQQFVKPAHKNATLFLLFLFGFLAGYTMLMCDILTGGVCLMSAVMVFIYYRYSAYKLFGGITGDLCGWFLQLCEVWMLAAVVIANRFTEVFL